MFGHLHPTAGLIARGCLSFFPWMGRIVMMRTSITANIARDPYHLDQHVQRTGGLSGKHILGSSSERHKAGFSSGWASSAQLEQLR